MNRHCRIINGECNKEPEDISKSTLWDNALAISASPSLSASSTELCAELKTHCRTHHGSRSRTRIRKHPLMQI